jgi:hypothetical protein
MMNCIVHKLLGRVLKLVHYVIESTAHGNTARDAWPYVKT